MYRDLQYLSDIASIREAQEISSDTDQCVTGCHQVTSLTRLSLPHWGHGGQVEVHQEVGNVAQHKAKDYDGLSASLCCDATNKSKDNST